MARYKFILENTFLRRTTGWKHLINQEKGVQIDLVIDRRDQIINLFEIKYSINEMTITKDYDAVLRQKVGLFREKTATRKSVFLTMLTTHGIGDNAWKHASIQNELTMDVLFE